MTCLSLGATHFEALQMLSQQWNTRVAPQIRRLTTQRRVVFEEISRSCSEAIEAEDEVCDPDEFDPQQLEEHVKSLLDRVSLIVPSDKLINVRLYAAVNTREIVGIILLILCRQLEKECLTTVMFLKMPTLTL